jgi:hypothetical protein
MSIFSRRSLYMLGVLVLLGWVTPVRAIDPEPLKEFLIELSGWESPYVDSDQSTLDGRITHAYAERPYLRGEAKLTATVGHSQLELQIPQMPTADHNGVSIQSGDAMIQMSPVRGFRVVTVYNAAAEDGMVVVFLGNEVDHGTFVVQFQEMTLADAMVLAERFDWVAMQAGVPSR